MKLLFHNKKSVDWITKATNRKYTLIELIIKRIGHILFIVCIVFKIPKP